MPRFAYWTIIVEGQPTAFRALDRETLLPTLHQLKNRHPDTVLKWFARGRLWESPEEERAALRAGRRRQSRGAAWRPGGEHRDPRARYQLPRDVRRKKILERLREKDAAKRGAPQRSGETGPPPRPAGARGGGTPRPLSPRSPQSRDRGPAGERGPGAERGRRGPGGPGRNRKPGPKKR